MIDSRLAAKYTWAGIIIFVGLVAGAAANPNVHVTRFWHNHQPLYWPDWNRNGSQTNRGQYAWDSIVLKPTQNFNGLSTKQHPENNLTDIFGLDDRRNAYQNRPRDSLATFSSQGGFALSYSGSLIDNVRQLGAGGHLGYSSGWWNGNREARTWLTPSGSRRLDLVGFTYHHSLAPLLPKPVLRKEIQIFKQAWWKAWNGNPNLSDHSKGFFPTEMAFSRHLVDVLVDEGYEWVIVASHHLSRTCPTYFNVVNPTGTWNIYSSPPNRADLLGPSPTTGWWYSEPNPGNAAWNVAPYAYQLHRVQYINPETGAQKTMIMVPSDDVLSYRYGYANEGIGKIGAFISPFATNSARPVIVMPATDGDNAWGGGYSSWMEATPQFFNDSAAAGYKRTTPQDFVNQFGAAAPIVHIEDGAWIFPEMDYGSPYFLKWIEPPLLGTGATNRFANTGTDFETPGFSLKFFSYAPLMAGANWVETAEQIHKQLYGANSVQAWKIQAPYDWDGTWTGANVAELGWHIYLKGLDSGFNYYGGLGNDDEVKPGLATKNAIQMVKPFVDANINLDQTPPTVLKPQRFPWNPGGWTFGWFNRFGSGTNLNFLKKMSTSEFYIWTHAYDVSGITSIVVKVRKDHDGTNSMATTHNETYAGGPDVGSWHTIPMTKRELPKTRSALNARAANSEIDYVVFDPAYWPSPIIADYYFVRITDANVPGFRGKLLDYYIEAIDGRGNVHRSEIQHVFVEDDGAGAPAAPEVSFSADPRDCAPLTVTYRANEGPLSNVAPVILWSRFSNSGPFTSVTMTTSGGTSTYTFATVPDNAPVLQIYFQNSSGTLTDNNNGANYSTSIRDCEAPTGPSTVVFSNAPACQPVTISYYPNAGPLQTATQVFLHLGYNQWSTVIQSQAMTKITNNLWRITVTPPASRTNINMVFHNGLGVWDNNNGQDWHFALNPCNPPTIPNGLVITNPPATTTVSYDVTVFTVQGTAGPDLQGFLRWSNSLNGATGLFSHASQWSIANVPLAVGTNLITVTGTNSGFSLTTNAADRGANAAYQDGWQAGDNGGSGFGPWSFHNSSSDPNRNGQFMATSAAVNIGTPAWGLYANNGHVADVRRPLPVPLSAGQTLHVKMDNGFINNGGGVGIALWNAQSNLLWEFYFNGGDQNYSISGGSTDVGWTSGGIDIELTLTGPTSWVARITPLGGSTRTNIGHFVPQANMTAALFRAWNYNAGSGSDYDFFLNDLRITSPGSGSGSSTSATVAIIRLPGISDADGDGLSDAWETAHFGCATCAVSNADSDGDGASNLEEFIADTVPTNSLSVWIPVIPAIAGTSEMQIWVPSPTTNSRIYEVWWSTNLLNDQWVPMGFHASGQPNGSSFPFTVTNTQPMRVYRIGVRLP
ncbi:MAG: carbohydrate-binding protein [Kiritimatiellae bacterium]|nr:carbohydrate-binding protein [Kiritimatiellia bacterium]MDW8457767.1 carbohydrate-binding protein [Verrucomicrobiota bacterium]